MMTYINTERLDELQEQYEQIIYRLEVYNEMDALLGQALQKALILGVNMANEFSSPLGSLKIYKATLEYDLKHIKDFIKQHPDNKPTKGH